MSLRPTNYSCLKSIVLDISEPKQLEMEKEKFFAKTPVKGEKAKFPTKSKIMFFRRKETLKSDKIASSKLTISTPFHAYRFINGLVKPMQKKRRYVSIMILKNQCVGLIIIDVHYSHRDKLALYQIFSIFLILD